MYNSYLYSKRLKQHKCDLTTIEKSARSLDLQQKFREKLLAKYKIRISKKVLDLAIHPVPVQMREQTKSPHFIGDSIMRLRPRDSKARITEVIFNQKNLDLSPIQLHKNDFRPRHKEKEIQGDMKFTPKDRFERLVDKWASDKEIINTWEIKIGSNSPVKINNKKLYYKTIETVALNVAPEVCSKDNSRVLLKQISEENFWDEIGGDDREKLGIIAQNAMEKCGLRPLKHLNYFSANRSGFY